VLMKNIMRHYSINFDKSAEMPVYLDLETYHDFSDKFPPICDISEGVGGTGTNPSISLTLDDSGLAAASCTSVQGAMSSASTRKSIVEWAEYSMPSFYGYGRGVSRMNFNDVSKWNIGYDDCMDNQIDSIYESTSAMSCNGCNLNSRDMSAIIYSDCSSVSFGTQVDRKTFDLSNELWREVTDNPAVYDQGKLEYAFRALAPHRATLSSDWFGDRNWQNPFQNYMLERITQIFASTPGCGSILTAGQTIYEYPGFLFGDGSNLFTVDEMWAKAKVARPGITIIGHGRGVESILSSLTLRAMPVYQVDFPAPIAAAGENWDEGCVDPFDGIRDNMYCTIEDDVPTSMERLQEAQTGNTINVNFPYLFPDFAKYGTSSKAAFNACCSDCLAVANMLWDYVKRYMDEPNKNMTYICGPPTRQEDLPQLGHTVNTPYGPRTVNSISYSYSDGSSYLVNIDVGPVRISQATAGKLTKLETRTENVRGRVISQEAGALYKVSIPKIGVIKAWNKDYYPWEAGDTVQVTLYNHPVER
jgi:hypothetical protein